VVEMTCFFLIMRVKLKKEVAIKVVFSQGIPNIHYREEK